ncbi:uncharacterized protein WM294_004139 isoform 2-T5 [Sarcoramphus papa]
MSVADLISIPGWSKTDRFEFASIVVKNSLPKEMRLSDWHQSATSEVLLSNLDIIFAQAWNRQKAQIVGFASTKCRWLQICRH